MDEETSQSTDGVEWSARKKATEFVESVTRGAIDYAHGRQILCRPEIRIERLSQCWEPCEYYDEVTDRCKVCTCKVKGITAVLRKKCPVGKW